MPDSGHRKRRRGDTRWESASLEEIFGGPRAADAAGREPRGPVEEPARPLRPRWDPAPRVPRRPRRRRFARWGWVAASAAVVAVAFGAAFGTAALVEGGGGSPVRQVQGGPATAAASAAAPTATSGPARTSPAGTSASPGSATPGTARPGSAAPAGHVWHVASASAYDPLGDGTEHNSDAHLAIDGDPATAWETDTYTTAALGGLKAGVGLVLDLGATRPVRHVTVRFGVSGTSMAVYVGNRPGTSGHPAATVAGAGSAARLSMSVRGRYVTLWLTALPPAGGGGYRGEIADVRVTG